MQLGHIFISGIRFDTELHHAVQPNTRRVSYIPLPIKADRDKDQDGGLLSLVQAVTVLTQKRFTSVAKSLVHQGITHPDKLNHQSEIAVAGQSIRIQHLQNAEGVMDSIVQGQVGLLHLALLDSQEYEPWCTGHNARLELGKQFCIYRVLTGGYKAVQLKQMCILSQATTTLV
jgi:hypothetical protein